MTKKKCLITGYPGFLGSSLYQQLNIEDEMHSLGLVDEKTNNHTISDLSKGVPTIPDLKYDLVIHAAGKAHIVPRTEAEKQSFDSINHIGTINLLRALENLSEPPKALVLVSSVSVYGRDIGDRITESDSLDATDPYGQSKIKAEEAVMSWDHPETIKGILRLPLIVGPNPPGNLGRMLKAIQKRRYFNVAGGKARRSFVWIEDIAPFVIRLAEKGGTYNLTDGHDVSFAELYEGLCSALHTRPNPSLPKCVARPLAVIGDVLGRMTHKKMPFDSLTYKKMTSDLTFSCEKAVRDFNWKPTPVLERLGEVLTAN